MSRARILKPEFWSDEKVVEVSHTARLLFQGIWNFADNDGRMEYSPIRLKLQIFPGKRDKKLVIDIPLQELVLIGLIQLYAVAGREYISVPNLEKHQPRGGKRYSHRYPDPPGFDPIFKSAQSAHKSAQKPAKRGDLQISLLPENLPLENKEDKPDSALKYSKEKEKVKEKVKVKENQKQHLPAGQKSPSRPLYQPIVDIFSRVFPDASGMPFEWDARSGQVLNRMLDRHKKWQIEHWEKAIANYYLDDRSIKTAEFYNVLPRLADYMAMPITRSRPMNGAQQNAQQSRSQEISNKNKAITASAAAAVFRRDPD